MRETRPVLIVGAGPTGMTAALELGRFGVPVRLVDKYAEPSETSRALAVQARTLELMEQRGLAEEMVRRGNKGLFATIYAEGRQLGRVDLRTIESRFNFTLLLAQSETERILREHLLAAGIVVERQTEMVTFAQKEGASGVVATLRRGDGTLEEVEGAYLIDAEGAHSTVRRTMGLPFEGKSLPHSYALADLYVDGPLPEDELSIFVPESGLLAAFPMGGGRFRVIATEKESVPKDAAAPTVEYIDELWRKGSHVPVRFRDLVWSSRFLINSRALDQLRHGAIFFGGDSAHIHSPAGGQGMNTGIQDMVNLGWKMAMVYRGEEAAGLLDTYDEERMPIIRRLVNTTERATDVFNSDSHWVHVLLQQALPVAMSLKGVRERGATMISELGGNYRGSSLAADGVGSGTLRAGDRFPDVAVDAAGQTRALDLLDPSMFTVLVLGGGAWPEMERMAGAQKSLRVKACPEVAASVREMVGEAAVVRPDGYVLCLGNRREVEARMREWSERWLVRGAAALG